VCQKHTCSHFFIQDVVLVTAALLEVLPRVTQRKKERRERERERESCQELDKFLREDYM
jgi:arginine/lysine/ornithine decarboxylase